MLGMSTTACPVSGSGTVDAECVAMPALVPQLPESAPFSEVQRHWLNGFLAGLFSEADPSPSLSNGEESKGRIVLLFGSQSGNADALAEEYGARLRDLGFEAPVLDMAEHEELDLAAEKTLILITSTWGEGDPPDNAVEFWGRLSEAEHPRLENLAYAVCGLGDSNYLDFCGMGKRFDARLAELGATALVPRIDCDVDFEEPSAEWFETVLFKLDTGAGAEAQASPQLKKGEPSAFSKKNPFPAAVIRNRRLTAESSERDTRHYEISLAGSGLQYEAGDALGVVPRNNPETADELLAVLGFEGDDALRTSFLEDYAITIPSRKLVAAYAEATGKDFTPDELWGLEVIDLVSGHPEVRFSTEEFTALLGKLQPRLYSISSSPRAHTDEVHLTVATVRYESHGRHREGVCSTFLAERVGDGTVGVFVHPSKNFKPPADPAQRMIMVGPGTGIAPFRAFLEDRRAKGHPGQNWLFFGNPHRSTDFLYKDELHGMIEEGVLHRFDTAWSRDGESKVYVQDRMRESAEELWHWLEGGAHFYVCGDAKRMAKDVDTALREVIAQQGGLGEDGAAEYVAGMTKAKRYQRDVY